VTVRVSVSPAPLVAVTVNSCAPSCAVSSRAPSATVPVQLATAECGSAQLNEARTSEPWASSPGASVVAAAGERMSIVGAEASIRTVARLVAVPPSASTTVRATRCTPSPATSSVWDEPSTTIGAAPSIEISRWSTPSPLLSIPSNSSGTGPSNQPLAGASGTRITASGSVGDAPRNASPTAASNGLEPSGIAP